ncbi:MAG: M24 family metallopeptidase [Armatimonadota bacterium]
MTRARLAKLREAMSSNGIDALLVTGIQNLRYITGFTGSAGAALVTQHDALFFADPRYTAQAAVECPDFEIVPVLDGFVSAIAGLVKDKGWPAIGFEKHHVRFATYEELRDAMPNVSLVATSGLVEDLRLLKDEHEITAIRRAAEVADAAFAHALKVLRPGITERELALEIEWHMRKLGAAREGFPSIVASGTRTALPHASPTDKPIQKGDFVTMDFGAYMDGYNSDITRTVCMGPADPKQREVYEIVRQAQQLGVEAIRPGVKGQDVDKAAREFIANHGYGPNFGHGLGHGLGLEVHDVGALNKTSNLEIRAGMVFTVEPGIYVEGWGGVRIEDDVLVTETGAGRLTSSTRDLLEL